MFNNDENKFNFAAVNFSKELFKEDFYGRNYTFIKHEIINNRVIFVFQSHGDYLTLSSLSSNPSTNYKEVEDLVIHNENDNPAFIENSKKFWYKDGLIHRDNDKPAVIDDTYKQWYLYGFLHRENFKPATIEKVHFNKIKKNVSKSLYFLGSPHSFEDYQKIYDNLNEFKFKKIINGKEHYVIKNCYNEYIYLLNDRIQRADKKPAAFIDSHFFHFKDNLIHKRGTPAVISKEINPESNKPLRCYWYIEGKPLTYSEIQQELVANKILNF